LLALRSQNLCSVAVLSLAHWEKLLCVIYGEAGRQAGVKKSSERRKVRGKISQEEHKTETRYEDERLNENHPALLIICVNLLLILLVLFTLACFSYFSHFLNAEPKVENIVLKMKISC
jgi:hypothetical protein